MLDGILQAKDRDDGSIGIRCSCRAAICGSCGVRINGKPSLACHMHLDKAAESATDGAIMVEPMGNMPVLKDLIVDMDAVHWKKIQRVTPWLLPAGEEPEREYIVPPESMIDVTQTMACIQCGACVSDCLSMEVDPLFIGPAALAKAYRFVGDPRDGQQYERLKDLSEDPHGIYDCTHCFNCIEACPKGVAPMSQIMRLRRIAGATTRSTTATTATATRRRSSTTSSATACCTRPTCCPTPTAASSTRAPCPSWSSSLPVILKALQRGKVTPRKALHAPAQGARRGQAHLRARPRQAGALRAQPLRRRRGGRAGAGARARVAGRRRRQPPARGEEPEPVKVAYWPGCVSRGFTPELHGSMAKVAPLLDIELVELDRACCCGAGVIAEHNQELADTLNARTFALAQQVEGADLMMNICSTCQGAQSECQERLDANTEYREHVNETLAAEGLTLRAGHHQQALPLADGRGDRARRDRARRSSGR